jgi:hypothetical protein
MITDDSPALTPEDDKFHFPDDSNMSWCETSWFAFWVPERRLTGYMYPFVRVNDGIVGGGAMVWDDRGKLPWDCLVWNYEWHTPIPDPLGDLRDIQFPTGLWQRCVEPLSVYDAGYKGPGLEMDIKFRALMPPHYLAGAKEETKVYFGHFDQPGRITGYIVVDGETIPVDCYGTRDRSWGPRFEDPSFRLGYDYGQNENEAFCAYSYPDLPGSPVQKGFLWRDGTMGHLVSGTRTCELIDGAPQRTIIRAEDDLGRQVEVTGDIVNRIQFLNVPWMLNWNCLTRWDLSGVETYGETQDIWHLDIYRRYIRSLRGASPTR